MDQTIMLGAAASVREVRFPSNPGRRCTHNKAYQLQAETVLGDADYQNDDPCEQKAYRAIVVPCVAPGLVGVPNRLWF